jgi:hypothetical protein
MNNDVTTIIIDTENLVLANHALKQSCRLFPTANVLALTNNIESFAGFEKILIDKINTIEDYNKIIINYVSDVVRTDFVLIIQFDGFVINPQCFHRLFYSYDYIGASWTHFYTNTVGNGGFSLRSIKLLKAVKEISSLRKNNMSEDEFICRYARSILEYDYKIKFAPPEIADLFSKENKILNNPTFGFHGFQFLPQIYSKQPNFLLSNLSQRFFKDRYYRILVKTFGVDLVDRFIEK